MISNLKAEYYKWVEDWQEKLNQDEWHFTRFRQNVTNNISHELAFNQISQAVELVLEQNEPCLILESFEILLSLCMASDTTEIPPLLAMNWNRLESLLCNNDEYYRGRFKTLKAWYRRFD